MKVGLIITGTVAAIALIVVGVSLLRGPEPISTGNANVNTTANTNSGLLPGTNTSTGTGTTPAGTLPVIGTVNNTPTTPDTRAQGGYTTSDTVAAVGAEVIATAEGDGIIYYDSQDGKFYRVGADGSRTVLSEEVFHSVSRVTWSVDRTRAIIEYPDQSKIAFDFSSGSATALPREATDFGFSADGRKITYKFVGTSQSERWLAVANPDGSGQQIVESLGDNAERVSTAWSPDGQVVGFFSRDASADDEEVFPLGQFNENFRSFTVPGSHFTARWSPDGTSLLFSVASSASNYLPTLYLSAASGSEIGTPGSLGITTWPDKCAFSASRTLYCAVPQTLPTGAGLYPELATESTDAFWRIDLLSGNSSLVALPASGSRTTFSATNLAVTTDESRLYFVDQLTGSVQELRLK